MKTIAITGGVACGKSLATHFLLNRFIEAGLDARQFNCDESVSNWLTDAQVRENLQGAIGPLILNEDGSLNRAALRKEIFGNALSRKKAEAILHPKVLESVTSFLRQCSKDQISCVLVEVPLLYESSFPLNRDADVLVGSSYRNQLNRLITLRQLAEEIAIQIIDAQFSLFEKIAKANYVIWNDGCLEAIQNQLFRLSKLIISQVTSSHERTN